MTANDEEAYNFAPEGSNFYLFLATTNNTLMMNWPVTMLSSVVTKQSSYGMVDGFDTGSTRKAEFNPAKLEEEIKELQKSTLPVLMTQAKLIER